MPRINPQLFCLPHEVTENIYLKNKELLVKNGTKIFEKIFVPLGVECPPIVDGFYVRFNASGKPKGKNDGD